MTDVKKELQKLKALINQRPTTAIFSNKSNESDKITHGDAEFFINDMTKKFTFTRSGIKNPVMVDPQRKALENVEFINGAKVEDMTGSAKAIEELRENVQNLDVRATDLEMNDVQIEQRLSNVEGKNNEQDSRINNVEAKNNDHESRISTCENHNHDDKYALIHHIHSAEEISEHTHTKFDNNIAINGDLTVHGRMNYDNGSIVETPIEVSEITCSFDSSTHFSTITYTPSIGADNLKYGTNVWYCYLTLSLPDTAGTKLYRGITYTKVKNGDSYDLVWLADGEVINGVSFNDGIWVDNGSLFANETISLNGGYLYGMHDNTLFVDTLIVALNDQLEFISNSFVIKQIYQQSERSRTLTLLDQDGNTTLPGDLTVNNDMYVGGILRGIASPNILNVCHHLALNNKYEGIVFFSDYSWYDGNVYVSNGDVMNGKKINKDVKVLNINNSESLKLTLEELSV